MVSSVCASLEELLEPQERFESLRKDTVLRSGKHLCDLSYANPESGPTDEVRAAIADALNSNRALDLQYTPYGGATISRRLIAQHLRRTHGLEFGWRSVNLTPGAMSALNMLFRLVRAKRTGPAEVIVPVPCWMDYPLYLHNLGLTCKFVPLRKGSFSLDLEAIESQLNENTCAIIITQPANPTGRVYEAKELQALSRLLSSQRQPPMLISDESHRDVVPETITKLVSPSAFYPNTCVVYSFGKHLALQGQRLGYVAVSPDFENAAQLASDLERWARIMGFCTPTALMQKAVRKLLGVVPDWEDLIANRDFAFSYLEEQGIDYVRSDATYFVYCAAPGWDDFKLAEQLAERHVLVLPGPVFHHHGYFRISLTSADESLRSALPTIAETVQEKQ